MTRNSGNSTSDTSSFSNETSDVPAPDLLERLATISSDWEGKLVAVAGHHMLVYREGSDALVPLMRATATEAQASAEEKANLYRVGDFPEASFRLALSLAQRRSPRETSIALLVNDHQFRLFQANAPSDDAVIQELRWRYYRESNSLPLGLRQVAADYPDVDVCLEHNKLKRSRGSALPSDSIYFSETTHRRRFKNWVPSLESLSGWRKRGADYGFCSSLTNDMLWLCDEQGGCGCSGEVVDFLLDLAQRQARHVLLIVPCECERPVRIAAEIVLQVSSDLRDVVVVTDHPEHARPWQAKLERSEVTLVLSAHLTREDVGG